MGTSTVTSEALQLKLRQLLPSQQGFGTDISASDTIIPIIDLTASAEGSDVREDLQKAWDFSTGFNKVRATTTTVINNTGFWKVSLSASYSAGSATASTVVINDGSADKEVWAGATIGSGSQVVNQVNQFVVFLRAGDSLKVIADSGDEISIWYRQIADLNGTLTSPLGFTPQ